MSSMHHLHYECFLISRKRANRILTFDYITNIVCEYSAVQKVDVFDNNRSYEIMNCKRLIIFLSKQYVKGFTLSVCANFMHLANHTSILHHLQKMKDYIETKQEPYYTDYLTVKKIIDNER